MTATEYRQVHTQDFQKPKQQGWIKRSVPIIKKNRFTFITALLFSFVALVMQVQVPSLLNNSIDDIFRKHSKSVSGYVIEILVLAVLSGISGLISRRNLYATAYAIEYELRRMMFDKFSSLSHSFYDKVQIGQLISRANSDIRSVQMYLTFAPMILVQLSMALVALVYMLMINVVLALLSMLVLPLVFVIGLKMRQEMFPISWLTQARLADIASTVDESVSGVRVVKSFLAEEKQLKKLIVRAKKVQWALIKDADIRARWTPYIQNLPQVGLLIVLLYGGYLSIYGRLGIGAIVAFNSYLLMLQAPFMMLGMLIMMGQRASASASRIYEVIDQESELTESNNPLELKEPPKVIEFKNVTFSYFGSENQVLNDLNLKIVQGKSIAIVGRTGSGKSTLAKLIPRYYDPTSGQIFFDGIDLKSFKLSSVRQNVVMVYDEPFLFSTTIEENIKFAKPDANLAEVIEAAKLCKIHDFIISLPQGYDTVVGERGYSLSGGQRQRIALARAILIKPTILILDDALSSVDVSTEKAIVENLRKLKSDMTLILIAQRSATIALADEVVLLEDGLIKAVGSHQELSKTNELYKEILLSYSLSGDNKK